MHCVVTLQPYGLTTCPSFDRLRLKPCNRTTGHLRRVLRNQTVGDATKRICSPPKVNMASLRTLFLGVYASNAVIRVLFLPLCYVLLLGPFLTLAGYYLGFGRTLRAYVPEDFSWIDLLPQIVLSTVFVLLPTRLLSGWGHATKSDHGGKRRVQSLPYWIPGSRHFWSVIFGGERWLKGVR